MRLYFKMSSDSEEELPVPVTKELSAYVRLFKASAYDFQAMKKDDSYFVEAALLIFQRYKNRPIFPPCQWVEPAVTCQAQNLCRVLLDPRGTWGADAQTLSTSQFWSKLRDLSGTNISILLYLRKLCLLSDGSARNDVKVMHGQYQTYSRAYNKRIVPLFSILIMSNPSSNHVLKTYL